MNLHLVMLGAASGMLVCRHGSALRAGIILFQSEREKKHNYGRNAKDPESIDISQSGSLCLHSRVDSGESLALCGVQAKSLIGELLDEAAQYAPELRVPHARTRNQRRLVKL